MQETIEHFAMSNQKDHVALVSFLEKAPNKYIDWLCETMIPAMLKNGEFDMAVQTDEIKDWVTTFGFPNVEFDTLAKFCAAQSANLIELGTLPPVCRVQPIQQPAQTPAHSENTTNTKPVRTRRRRNTNIIRREERFQIKYEQLNLEYCKLHRSKQLMESYFEQRENKYKKFMNEITIQTDMILHQFNLAVHKEHSCKYFEILHGMIFQTKQKLYLTDLHLKSERQKL